MSLFRLWGDVSQQRLQLRRSSGITFGKVP